MEKNIHLGKIIQKPIDELSCIILLNKNFSQLRESEFNY